VSTTVWRLQASTQAWAGPARELLVQLTGKAARPGRVPTASVLLAGIDKLFSLLEALGPEAVAPLPISPDSSDLRGAAAPAPRGSSERASA